MIHNLIRKTTYYRIAIVTFLLFLIMLLFLAYQKHFELMLVYFVGQVLLVFFFLIKAVNMANKQLKREWFYLIDDDLDPQALLDKYLSDSKHQSYPDVIANSAHCYFLMGDFSRAITMELDAISKEKEALNLMVYQISLSSFYDANQEYDMGKQAYLKAEKLWKEAFARNNKNTALISYQGVFMGKEKAYAYREHRITLEEYAKSIKQRLMQEEMTKRARVQLHYQLADLYLEQGDVSRASDEIKYVDEFGQKTYMYGDIHMKLKKLEGLKCAGDLL